MGRSGARPWEAIGRYRRYWLSAFIILPACSAGLMLAQVLADRLPLWLEIPTLTIFALLFAWISAGFWTALVGFILLMRGRTDTAPGSPELRLAEPRPQSRVAIVMPIYNEEVERVAAGLQATYKSLQHAGALAHFEFFLLSDTRDPAIWLREELVWSALCQSLDAFGRIHYRRRPINNKAKSGNVADFCRRWGKDYEYMVVLDADSVMNGETLYRMLEMMEGNPQVGIIQTQPVAVNRETLYARLQQFAQHLYGPIFSAGLRFWQLGDGHYIGHNAILRTAPFTQYCALPVLPGRPPLGGPLLSHDFVEAALMAKSGWGVWFVPSLSGSYEEVPPTLIDDLKRDRRWAQGNLQHLRLLAGEGLRSAHRFLFINGAMSFLAAPLWGLFLILGALGSLHWATTASDGSITSFDWGWLADPMPFWLFGVTAVLLLSPKFMAVLWVVRQRGQKENFGGLFCLVASMFFESIFSILMAPIRMAFHSQFVIQTLMGRGVRWGTQVRGDQETSWADAFRYFGWCSVLGLSLAALLYPFLGAWHFAWLVPILGGLTAAVPLAAWTSRPALGRWARRHRLFVIPEEVHVPQELQTLGVDSVAYLPHIEGDPFIQVVVDPRFNAIHTALQRNRTGAWSRAANLCHKALEQGPQGLNNRERNVLLSDRNSMLALHRAVWSTDDSARLAAWGLQSDDQELADAQMIESK
ncbi:MAG: glucans biosynthesis glucosyltransferase MdoH [Acidithiobacillus sp.]|jgi:membrane glycosyltransferase